MKKHLIAAAVAAAVAVPAAAQVTLSGRIDQSFGSFKSGSTSENVVNSNVGATSRLTFSGSEDLGGGLRAEFFLENGVTPDANAALSQFSRESYIGVSGGFGRLQIGKVTGWSADIDVFVNATGKLGGMNNGLAKAQSATAMDGLGDSANNSIAYTSPSFSGLQIQVQRAQGEKQGAATGDQTGITARFTRGPLRVSAGSTTTKGAVGADQKQQGLGIGYNMGVAKFGYFYGTYDPSKTVANDEREYSLVTVGVPLGAVTLYGAHHASETENRANEEAKAFVLGAEYGLSKRTGFYVEYAKVDNKGSAANLIMSGMNAGSGTGVVGNSTTAGTDARLISAGFRHFF